MTTTGIAWVAAAMVGVIPLDVIREAWVLAALKEAQAKIERDPTRPGKPVIKVDLEGRVVGDAGLKGIGCLTQLQELNLFDTGVGDAGMKELVLLQQLRFLKLFDTNVSDTGLKELGRLRHLEDLDLGLTKVTDTGLKELAGLVRLQRLGLYSTSITDAGLKELAPFRRLRVLNLQGTRVTDAGPKDQVGLAVRVHVRVDEDQRAEVQIGQQPREAQVGLMAYELA